MPVTLRDVLNLASASEMKLIAGSEGLDRDFKRPVVSNSCCIPACIYGGELLFITGADLRTNAGILQSLISECSIENLAGIVFSNNYVIDDNVIDFANSLTFPIFHISRNTNLVKIIKDMTNFVIRRKNEPSAACSEMFSLLYDTLDCNEIEKYCDKNIGKLIDYDKMNGSELVRTIEVYFENKFNLTHTAKVLMIHRNSLMYRLRRIEEIIGHKLDDPYYLLDIVNSIFIKKTILSVRRTAG